MSGLSGEATGGGVRMGVRLLAVALLGVLIVAVFTMARKVTNRLPRCPHCGIRFTRLLLPIAIATGNCGHCGRSIEG